MISWFFFCLFSLVLSKKQFFSKTSPLQDHYVQPISCIDKGFDIASYIKQQKPSTNEKGIEIKANSLINLLNFRKDFFGAHFFFPYGHSWAQFGKTHVPCLQQDLKMLRKIRDSGRYELDVDGCVPYLNHIEQFTKLKQCLHSKGLGKPRGPWIKADKNRMYDQFKNYKVDNMEQFLYYYSIQASSENPIWAANSTKLNNFYHDREDINDKAVQYAAECLDKVKVTRDDMKCFTPLMASPGFTPSTILDHLGNRPVPTETEYCNVNPVCGRLAMEKMHHMQALEYGVYKGIPKGIQMRQRRFGKKRWVKTTPNPDAPMSYPQRVVHNKCQLLPSYLGDTVCWHFTRCLPEILKLVCIENTECCPSKYVHASCKYDIADPDCEVCIENKHSELIGVVKDILDGPDDD